MIFPTRTNLFSSAIIAAAVAARVPLIAAALLFAHADRAALGAASKIDSTSFDFEIMEIINVDPEGVKHRAFPGLTRLQDGRLLLVYKEGRGHWAHGDVPVISYSSDEGATWTKPKALVESTPKQAYGTHNGPLQLENGRILVPYMSLEWDSKRATLPYHLKPYVFSSKDNGRSWASHQLGPAEGWEDQNVYGRVTVVGNEVWLPVGGRKPGDAPHYRSSFFVSRDGGETWPEIRDISTQLGNEKEIIKLGKDRVLALVRSETNIQRSVSEDGGATWSQPAKLSIWGQGFSALSLSGGAILLAYREVEPGNDIGLRLAVSMDEGRTWQKMGYVYRSPSDANALGGRVGRDSSYSSMIPAAQQSEVLIAYYTAARTTTAGINSNLNVATVRIVPPR